MDPLFISQDPTLHQQGIGAYSSSEIGYRQVSLYLDIFQELQHCNDSP